MSKKQGVLNHIAFNREEPVIVVGDSRGHVHSLKLSPNLRKRSKEAQAAVRNKERKKFLEMETRKLDQIVNQVMEPLARRDTDSDPEQWGLIMILLDILYIVYLFVFYVVVYNKYDMTWTLYIYRDIQ